MFTFKFNMEGSLGLSDTRLELSRVVLVEFRFNIVVIYFSTSREYQQQCFQWIFSYEMFPRFLCSNIEVLYTVTNSLNHNFSSVYGPTGETN